MTTPRGRHRPPEPRRSLPDRERAGLERSASRAGALDRSDPRRRELRRARAYRRRQDRGGVLAAALEDGRRGLARRVGALRRAHPRAPQQPGGAALTSHRAHRPARRQVARRRRRARAPSPDRTIRPTCWRSRPSRSRRCCSARARPRGASSLTFAPSSSTRSTRSLATIAARTSSALLERISRIAEADIQRIGLSATVGDPEAIVAWLSGSSLRPQRVVDPGGARRPPELALDFVGTLDNAALLIERLYPGTRRLVFVDSRRRVEELGHRLSQRGVDVYLSHSSLALSERAAAEKAFEEGTNCVIVATSRARARHRRRRPGSRDSDRRAKQRRRPSCSAWAARAVAPARRRTAPSSRPMTTRSCAPPRSSTCSGTATSSRQGLRRGRRMCSRTRPSRSSMQEQGSAAHAWWSWLEGCAAFRDDLGVGAREPSCGTWSTTTSSSRPTRASPSARAASGSTARETSSSSTPCSRRRACSA